MTHRKPVSSPEVTEIILVNGKLSVRLTFHAYCATFGAGWTGKTTLHAERTATLAAEALAASDGDLQRY